MTHASTTLTCALLPGNYLQLHKTLIHDIICAQYGGQAPAALYIMIEWKQLRGSWTLMMRFNHDCIGVRYRRTNVLKLPRVRIDGLRRMGATLDCVPLRVALTVVRGMANNQHCWYLTV